MANIKDGPIRRVVNLQQEYIQHLVAVGAVTATDGIQYTSAVTFGTGSTEILNQLIDPGYGMYLKEIQVGLTQKFINVKGAVGSLVWSWQAYSEYTDPRGSKHIVGPISVDPAPLRKGIGSLSNSEDTLSGYMSPNDLPAAPVRLILNAYGLVASSMTGAVKNSSFIKLIGIVIPGA